MNNFGWTHDPRLAVPFIPMILFPKQEEFLRFLIFCEEEGYDAVVEKSRDMGVTWLCCFFLVHRWLFKDGFKGAIGSRKEDLVDKADDPDCIFEKIRTILKRLPSWMLPRGFNWRVHDKHLSILNPDRLSAITGEAGDNMGRGGRNGPYFIDEAAFVERPNQVDAALSQNAAFRIYVSTPNGVGNPFAQKREAAMKDPDGPIRLFTLHWKDDPRKNHWLLRNPDGTIFAEGHGWGPSTATYPWYEKVKKIIRDPVIIAQEVDIDYTASIEGITIPAKYVDAAVNFDEWLMREKGLLLPAEEHDAGFDVAEEGRNQNVMTFRKGCVNYSIEAWNQLDTFLSAKKAVGFGNTRKVEILNFDSAGIGASMSGNFKSAQLGLRFQFRGINGSSPPTKSKWIDGVNYDGSVRYKLAKDKFFNLRAELWWLLRERFEKTYEYRVLGIPHPLKDLISILDHPELKKQLSSVLCFTSNSGKIQIESKKDMRDRGVDSPDFADSMVYCFAPRRKRQESKGRYAAQDSYS